MTETCGDGTERINLSEPVWDNGEKLSCAWFGCESDAVVKLSDITFPQLCQEHFILVRDSDDPAGMRKVEVEAVEYRDGEYRSLHTDTDQSDGDL
jgi:hypothetical protein